MSSEGSVTHWIGQLKAGDHDGAQQLWQRYFQRLVGLARKRLQDAPRRAADEEDVALSAFDSLCRGAERGGFAKLEDRGDLWQLLVVITARKAIDLREREGRLKRGGGALQLEGADAEEELQKIVGREPTPEFAAQVAEECERLLACLPNDELRSVANLKMEGYTSEEIADRLGCVPRTVERRLRVIRSLWSDDMGKE